MSTATLNAALGAVSATEAGREEWEQLYVRLWPYAFAILYRGLSGNRALAEDLCQEVMIRLIQSVRPQDYAPAAVLAFVRTACYRVTIDSRRKNHEWQSVTNMETFPSSRPSPESQAIDHDLAQTVRSRLTRNDLHLAQLLAEGASVDAIARSLSISRDAAYVRRHRLKRRVQQIAEELGGAP